jgi:hypothetical protein
MQARTLERKNMSKKKKQIEAEMLCSADGELWTVFVRGHVSNAEYDGAFWALMRDRHQDAYERFDETQEKYIHCVIEHAHLRPTRFDDGDMGQCYSFCRPSTKTGFPVTAIRFGNAKASGISTLPTDGEA